MFQLLYLVEASGLICLGNTEPGIRRAAESVLGGFVPSRQHRFADFQLQESGDATGLTFRVTRLQNSLGSAHPLACRRFCDLRSFASLHFIGADGLQVHRETAQIAKGWPSFRASLTRSRSCTIRNSRQSTLDPLNSCRKRNTADARPWVKGTLMTRGVAMRVGMI